MKKSKKKDLQIIQAHLASSPKGSIGADVLAKLQLEDEAREETAKALRQVARLADHRKKLAGKKGGR